MTVQETLQTALKHHQSGQLQQAEMLYRQVLQQDPANTDAMNLLGVLASAAGQYQMAIDLISRAIAASPGRPDYHLNLGNALDAAGRVDDSIAAFGKALNLKPDYHQAMSNLGNSLRKKGQFAESISFCRQAAKLCPNAAAAHLNLGNALQAAGKTDEAVAAFSRAIQIEPANPVASDWLGIALRFLGRRQEAVACFRRATELKPRDCWPFNHLTNALAEAGLTKEALAAYEPALQRWPNNADVQNHLGVLLRLDDQLDAAIAAFRRAIELRPNHHIALNSLAHALQAGGKIDEALASYQRAVDVHPEYSIAASNRLLALLYKSNTDPRQILIESKSWDDRYAKPLRQFIRVHTNNADPDRRLRIGYVSPDFCRHPVGRIIEPLFSAHDRARFEVHAYANVAVPDALTARLRSRVDAWRDIAGMPDDQAADLIQRDGIDILIDLAGHTAGNRLLLFARKPAPIQATFLGYPATTGLSTIDYRITDEIADPPGSADEYCTEQLIRLPAPGWCFCAPDGDIPVSEAPMLQSRRVTFGSFNNLSKVSFESLQIWAEILRQTPDSRLLIKARPLGDGATQEALRQRAAAAGIDPGRLDLSGWTASAGGHLATYHQIDIALDTYPYHGTATTFESLWMGVPVITLAGHSHVSRVGVSLLISAGLGELIAQSPAEYAKIAAELAADPARSVALRANLRDRLRNSSLMDAARFAGVFEQACRLMWRKWCAR